MSEINNGGPAFPSAPQQMQIDEATGKLSPIGFEGMTLRDWFASQALMTVAHENPKLPGDQGEPGSWPPPAILAKRRAVWAYIQADAMLAAREKIA